MLDQVVELGTVSCVVEIDHARCEVALSRVSSLQNLVEKAACLLAWVQTLALRISMRLDPDALIVFDVGVPGKATQLLRLLEVSLVDLPLFDVSLELVLPLLHVFVVERWRVGDQHFVFVLFRGIVSIFLVGL